MLARPRERPREAASRRLLPSICTFVQPSYPYSFNAHPLAHGMDTLIGGVTVIPKFDGGTCGGAGRNTLICVEPKDRVAGATVTVAVPLCAVPLGVVTENEYDPVGTLPATVSLTWRLWEDAPVIVAVSPVCVKLTAVALFRLVPVIVALVVIPCPTRLGSMALIVGVSMVNGCGLVAVPLVLVTVTGPVVAPVGTVVMIVLAVEEVTVADVPLNLTWLAEGVELNPKPWICTVVPTMPLEGDRKKMPMLPVLPPPDGVKC